MISYSKVISENCKVTYVASKVSSCTGWYKMWCKFEDTRCEGLTRDLASLTRSNLASIAKTVGKVQTTLHFHKDLGKHPRETDGS